MSNDPVYVIKRDAPEFIKIMSNNIMSLLYENNKNNEQYFYDDDNIKYIKKKIYETFTHNYTYNNIIVELLNIKTSNNTNIQRKDYNYDILFNISNISSMIMQLCHPYDLSNITYTESNNITTIFTDIIYGVYIDF